MLRYAVIRKGWKEETGSVIHLARDLNEAKAAMVVDYSRLQESADLRQLYCDVDWTHTSRGRPGVPDIPSCTVTLKTNTQTLESYRYEILFLGISVRAKLLSLPEGGPDLDDVMKALDAG